MKGVELLVVLAIIAVIVLVTYNSCGCCGGATKERLTQEYKPYEPQSKSSVLEGETPYAKVFY